jgi:hypothetical protein
MKNDLIRSLIQHVRSLTWSPTKNLGVLYVRKTLKIPLKIYFKPLCGVKVKKKIKDRVR